MRKSDILSRNFKIYEFVTPHIYEKLYQYAFTQIDERVIHLAQFVRDRFRAPVTVNNWIEGGDFQYRGVRPYNCPIGAKYSQHKFGRAFDFTIYRTTIEEIHEDIKKNAKLYYDNHLRAVEKMDKADTWMHFDVRPSRSNEIFWF